jgi:hypothetical protein
MNETLLRAAGPATRLKAILIAQHGVIARGSTEAISLDGKGYQDFAGITAGDEARKDVTPQLREAYSQANVYRFSGDEFVIELTGRQ